MTGSDPREGWRRRTLLATVAGIASTASLGACAGDTLAVGAPSGRHRDENSEEDAPSRVPGLLAYRTARNFGPKAAPAGSAYTIFQAFARGAVPRGYIARVVARGAPVQFQQCDNRVTWPDGSLRSGTFVWRHPHAIEPGGRDRITIHMVPGSWDNRPTATLDTLLAHDYRLQVVVAGTPYFLIANNEIRGGTRVRRIRAGNACTAWKIWGDLRSGTSASAPAHGQMWGKMFLYVTADGHIRIENEIYCNKITDSDAIPVTSYGLLDGGTVLTAKSNPFTFYTCNKIAAYDGEGREYFSGPDISKVVWAFPRPVLRNTTTTGLYDACITWWNKWTPAYVAAFASPLEVEYAPNSELLKIFPDGVNGTGNHTWLGPMTSFAVMAMLSGRYDYQRQDRIMALGAWGICIDWCADDETGLPPVFTNRTYRGLSKPIVKIGWGMAPTLRMRGGGNRGRVGDPSHAGLWWWWQYLATGSEQALENIMEQAVGMIGCNVASDALYQRNPKFANGKQYFGSFCNIPTSRAVGWAFRNLSNAHWVTPDGHPMQRYLDDLVQIQYDSAHELLAQMAPEWGPLAQWIEGTNFPLYAPGESPWMSDYRVTSVLMDYRRGRIPRDHLTMVHVVKHQYGRMVDGNFFNGAGAYRLSTGVGPNPLKGRVAARWSEVYGFWDPPNVTYPLVDTPPVLTGLRDQSIMHGPAKSLPPSHTFVGHTYPNIALCAGACGVICALGDYPEKVVAYLSPLIDGGRATEEMWGRSPGAQAWRIRAPE